ncbi:Alkanesulfonate monooxygenase [Streptomyces griseoloalbus]
MSLTFHWFLPTNGDSRHVVGGGHGSPATASGRDRPPTVAYLSQIARAAEDLGFTGALTPTGAWCEDAWLTTAMVSQNTERLKFLVAFRPGFVSPTLAAQMASTFQRQSGGRLLLNVVTGGESHEQRAYGDFLDKDDRYRRTDEFLHVVRELWQGRTVDLEGDHLRVADARLTRLPDPVPERGVPVVDRLHPRGPRVVHVFVRDPLTLRAQQHRVEPEQVLGALGRPRGGRQAGPDEIGERVEVGHPDSVPASSTRWARANTKGTMRSEVPISAYRRVRRGSGVPRNTAHSSVKIRTGSRVSISLMTRNLAALRCRYERS